MKVIHILNHCNHGHGNAHVAIDLACLQASHGYEVMYVSGGGDYEGLLKKWGVQTIHLPQQSRNPIDVAKVLLRLISISRDFGAEIVHAHMMAGAVLGYAASRWNRFPLVSTVHNSFDPHSVLMRLGDRVVAVSEAEKRMLIARGFSPMRVDFVLNGPNSSPREGWLNQSGDVPEVRRPCITTVCGLHRRKGVADLLEAFQKSTHDRPEWTLNIVGDGPDRQELQDISRNLGITDRVVFMGSIAQPREILDKSDIFVLASYADPCSLAVAEARYAGCAIVATAVGGTPELLDQGKHGLLVQPGKPEEIASALLRLMSSTDELRSWRERAKTGADYLVTQRVFSDYDVIYRRLLKSKPRA